MIRLVCSRIRTASVEIRIYWIEMDLLDALSDLKMLRHASSPSMEKNPISLQDRGYLFERLLSKALASEGLEPRTSYRKRGEQIDGSFLLGGRIYLLEAKWQATKLPASRIYEFRGKVEGKLVGTVGFFISMSDFSPDAPDAVVYGKELSVLLVTAQDLENALDVGSMESMFKEKLRAAAEEGVALAPYEPKTMQPQVVSDEDSTRTQRIVFVVEGPRDQMPISVLGERIVDSLGSDLEVETVAAGGKVNASRYAAYVRDQVGGEALVGIVVDSDGQCPAQAQRELGELPELRGRQVVVIAVDPNLDERWLGSTEKKKLTVEELSNLDLARLEGREESFKRFADSIRRHLRRQPNVETAKTRS